MSTSRDNLSSAQSRARDNVDDEEMLDNVFSDSHDDEEMLDPESDAFTPVIEEYDVEEDDGETTIYFDAEEGTFQIGVSEEIREEEEEEEGEEGVEEQTGEQNATSRTPQRSQPIEVTQEQLLQLLSSAGIRRLFQSAGLATQQQTGRLHVQLEDDEDDGEEPSHLGLLSQRQTRRSRRRPAEDMYPPIPSVEGGKLMDNGTFGSSDRCEHTACGMAFSNDTLRKRKKLARRVLDREMGIENRGRARALNGLAAQDMVPNSKADLIINLNARCYSGQFSEDGSFFFACGQDFKVRMYDTSNPYDWKYYKTVNYYGGQWTITDATLSPNNKLLAYSSIRSLICLANTEQGDHSDPRHLDFSDMGSGPSGGGGGGGWGRSRGQFGIWSLRFSGDGSEIVAGTSDYCVYVYDLEAQRSILRIPGHQDDVNAVCFGDKMSPHILYSGSDDTTLKVWDRRSLASQRPAGIFLGHTEGLTYIDSKGDGRYVISNGKDQTCKLWDLRKMINTDAAERINPQDYTTSFDYRFSPYDTNDYTPHPHDCSLVTFRGHRVLKTLIRCHFSPPGSTNGRYIYSGSHDGKIHIWNLDGTPASEPINVLEATMNSRPPSDEQYVDRYDYYGRGGVWRTIVRDCSWHPSAPVIAATSWNGWDHGLGTCTVHSWHDGAAADGDELGALDALECKSGRAYADAPSLGSSPMGARVNAQLQHDGRYYVSQSEERPQPRRTRLRDRLGLGSLWADAEEEDE